MPDPTLTLHLQMPRALDTLVHTGQDASGAAYACHTPRGAGICRCGLFRICDPGRLCCGDDCSCACHTAQALDTVHTGGSHDL